MGEHTTEARGVGGSIPSLPIKLLRQDKIYKSAWSTIIMVKKEEKSVKTSGDNSCGATSVNLGLVGIFLSVSMPLAGIVLGLVGLIFGYRQKDMRNNNWANWGIGLSLLSLALGIFLVVFIFTKLKSLPL